MAVKRTNRSRIAGPIAALSMAMLGMTVGGCGVVGPAGSPNRLEGAEGQLFFLDDLEDIAGNPNTDDDEKRESFRALGIQDEELIDALLSL